MIPATGLTIQKMLSSRRIRRHLMLGGTALGLFLILFGLVGLSPEYWVDIPFRKAESLLWRASMGTAYTALLFFALTLLIGPINVLRGRINPVNNMLRRDAGYWAGGLGLVHMALGLFVHTDNLQFWTLFFHRWPGPKDWLPLHKSFFGLANYAGLFQATLIVALLVVSNNRVLRRLGLQRWKNLQRLSYLAILSIAVHGISYQIVEQRFIAIQAVFLLILLTVIGLQSIGFFLRKYHQARDGQVNATEA